MSQQHGRNYENELVSIINENTTEDVVAVSVGYSGNDKYSFADVLVLTPEETHFIEAKKRNGEDGKRTTVMGGGHDGESGLDELRRLHGSTPFYASSWVALKWDYKAVDVFATRTLLDVVYGATCDTYLRDARTTPSENISIPKPEGDEHPSAVSTDDWDVLRDTLRLNEYEVNR